MKTLFLIVDSGTAIRNILRTSVLKTILDDSDAQIIIFSPVFSDEFKNEFESERVTVHPLPQRRRSRLESLIHSIRRNVWADYTGLFSFNLKRKYKTFFLIRGLFALLGKVLPTPAQQRLLKKLHDLEFQLAPKLRTAYFDDYNPDLVFYTSMFSPQRTGLELEAEQRKISSIAFIMSWDNTAVKGPLNQRPSKFIVWNEIMKNELIDYHMVEHDRIFVSPPPQFDCYQHQRSIQNLEDFCKKYSIPSGKKIISYTTGTPGCAPRDFEVVKMLCEEIKSRNLNDSIHLIIRPHPKDQLSKYEFITEVPFATLQKPGRTSSAMDSWNPSRENMEELAELMLYSDININVASTITIDAAIFDTPVINVAFDGAKNLRFHKSCRRLYHYEHYKYMQDQGGVPLANSMDELLTYLKEHLADPNWGEKGRETIRADQVGIIKWNSGQKIGEFISKILMKKVGLNVTRN